MPASAPDLQRFVERREISGRAMGLWRTLIIAPPDRRDMIVNEVDLPEGLTAQITARAAAIRATMGPSSFGTAMFP